MSPLQSMDVKATSPHNLMAMRCNIMNLIYSLLIITMFRKASRISASKKSSFTFNVRVIPNRPRFDGRQNLRYIICVYRPERLRTEGESSRRNLCDDWQYI